MGIATINSLSAIGGLVSIDSVFTPYYVLMVLSLIAVGMISISSILSRSDDEEETQQTEGSSVTTSATDDEVIDRVNTKNKDAIAEATRRLKNEERDITGEALSEKLDELEDEGDGSSVPTGFVTESTERTPVVKTSVSPVNVTEHDSITLKIVNDQGDSYHIRHMMLSEYPDEVTYGWLSMLFSEGIETENAQVRTSMYVNPFERNEAVTQLKKRERKLTSKIVEKRREDDISFTEEEQEREEVEGLKQRLQNQETDLFDVSIYVQIVSEDTKSLTRASQELRNYFSDKGARLVPISDRQRDGLRTSAPLHTDVMRNTRPFDRQSLATTFPFIGPSYIQREGTLLGLHDPTNSPVIVDRYQLNGYNALISGQIGSGKSFVSKLMMLRRLFGDSDIEILMIDPTGNTSEYVESALGGQVIEVGSDTIINPFKLSQVSDSAEIKQNPFEMKVGTIVSMLKGHIDQPLTSVQEGVLRRVVKSVYHQEGISRDSRTHGKDEPVFDDLLHGLRDLSEGDNPTDVFDAPSTTADQIQSIWGGQSAQKKKIQNASHTLYLALEEFRKGGQFSFLNGRSNVDMTDNIVMFDISNVVGSDKENQSIIMQIMLDFLFQRAKADTGRIMITIDEAHYLLDTESATQMLNTLTRHSRHYNAGLTLISQTIDEYMHGKAKEIYDQCQIRILMKHEDIGEKAMQSLGLTEAERRYVMNDSIPGNDDRHEYSSGLLQVNNESIRLKVYANKYEKAAVDEQSINPFTFMVEEGIMHIENVPQRYRDVVRAEWGQ